MVVDTPVPGPDASSTSGTDVEVALADELRSVVWDLNRLIREGSEPVTNLTMSHQMVLARLDRHPGLTQAGLAREERVRPQSMSTTLAQLFEHGYVEARADERDARQRNLYLTSEGQQLVDRIRSTRSDWLAQRIETSFDGSEREDLAKALALLRRLLDVETTGRG